MSVFYGVAVGLFCPGRLANYGDVDSKLALEAATAGLYRDVSHFPEPTRSMLQGELCAYVRRLIDLSPQFRQGIVDTANNETLNSYTKVGLSSSRQGKRKNLFMQKRSGSLTG